MSGINQSKRWVSGISRIKIWILATKIAKLCKGLPVIGQFQVSTNRQITSFTIQLPQRMKQEIKCQHVGTYVTHKATSSKVWGTVKDPFLTERSISGRWVAKDVNAIVRAVMACCDADIREMPNLQIDHIRSRDCTRARSKFFPDSGALSDRGLAVTPWSSTIHTVGYAATLRSFTSSHTKGIHPHTLADTT